MDIVAAAVISFVGFLLVLRHMPKHWQRRMVGYKGMVDIVLHGSIIYLFYGTSTLGLMQAELAGIMFSIYLRVYRWAWGCERLVGGRWMRYHGAMEK